jgi:phosphoribosyl 1,2-cyclic phosphodiesterase
MRFENKAGVISVATDLGHVTAKVLESLDYSDIVCLESNYDEDMLKICSYPYWLKKRIRGNSGHLANIGVRGIVSRLNRRPESLILMHLSQESNTPALVRENLEPFLTGPGSRLANTRIYVMEQDSYSPRIFQSTPLPEPLKRNLLMRQENLNFSDLPKEEVG